MASEQTHVDSAVLEFSDVVVDYERKGLPSVRAVAGVSLTVHRGQVHGLVGESGCGKSTLARAATGVVPTTEGQIHYEGQPVELLSRGARHPRLRRLQMVFQDPHASLNPRRRVSDQISDALRLATDMDKSMYDGRIAELLRLVGLPERVANGYPHEFSGGQRQRICIARALAAEPSVIIADEPISALDASAQAQIANLLLDVTRRLQVGLLFITHDLSILRHVADVVTVMYLGKVVETAPTAELWRSPLHPYSEALIGSVPRHDGRGVLPLALPGEVPDPVDPPSGCRFHPRCPYAFELCPRDEPPLAALAQGRSSACWLHRSGVSDLRSLPRKESSRREVST